MPSFTKAQTLPERAFPAHPRVDRYFAAGSVEAARRRLVQCVKRGDGPALLLGAPGVGKTMLLEALGEELAAGLRVVRIAGAQLCTRRALLQAILHGLGAPYANRDEGELRLSLADLLSLTDKPVALLVDEAQSLPTRLMEELRQLSNLAVGGASVVRLVLAGATALDEAFTAPELEAFNQRLAARCYLEPLSREETARYVRAHLGAAGADPDAVLGADAYEAITLASDGLPRLINQVCDRALVLAIEKGATVVDGAAIGEAWSDLHQLATPWHTPSAGRWAAAAAPRRATPSPRDEDQTVEFGLLDDEDVHTDALQAEAEAVTAMADAVRSNRGDWVAGDRLRELSAEGDDDPSVDDDEPVAYAFPNIATEADEPAAEEDGEPAPAPEAAAPRKLDAALDPFAEDFDDEELVLDPYASLERVIPAAPSVRSAVQSDLDRAYTALRAGSAEAPSVVPEQAVQTAASLSKDDDDILLVELDDSPASDPGARRLEYGELFAKLRHG